MSSINYSLTARNVRPGMESQKKVYAVAQAKEVVSLEDFAEHISCHNSLFDESVILGVLKKMVSCLREQLLCGNQVCFGDLGKFYITIKDNGADSVDSYDTSSITSLNVRFLPGDDLQNLLEEANFSRVLSRNAQAAALAAEKEQTDEQVGSS